MPPSSRVALLAALALVLWIAPAAHGDPVGDAISAAGTAVASAKAKLDDLLVKACTNLRELEPKCAKGTGAIQAVPKSITDKLSDKLSALDGCFRSKPSTAGAEDQQFVCCLDLQSYSRSTLCIPAVTLDANLPALLAKNITDKADDTVKKALAPIGDKINGALSAAKDALAEAQKKIDDVLGVFAALSG